MQNSILSRTKVWISPAESPVRKMYQQKANSKSNKQELTFFNLNASLKEKLLAFTCYLTCGLSGLILILLNFFTSKYTSLYVKFHTIQAVFLGIIIALSAFALKATSFISSAFIYLLEHYNHIYGVIAANFPFCVFCIVCVFGAIALAGKNILLPGSQKIANQILR